MTDLTGQTLGRYRLIRLIGRGGMADVYKAHDPELDRTVAIKVLSPQLANDPDFIGRFRHEARAIAGLRHQAIVRVHDFGTQGDTCYMVTEHIDGPSLLEVLCGLARVEDMTARTLPPDAVVRLVAAVCSALDYAHERDMVHRDIKPANVLLTGDLQPVVSDFGIARLAQATSYTAPGMILGTVHYMAPEQAEGREVDRRCDIYSTGVMTYEALTGSVPFRGETTGAVVAQLLTAPTPSARDACPELPAAVDVVLARAMAKAPADRFDTAGELAEALRRSLHVTPRRATGALLPAELAPTLLISAAGVAAGGPTVPEAADAADSKAGAAEGGADVKGKPAIASALHTRPSGVVAGEPPDVDEPPGAGEPPIAVERGPEAGGEDDRGASAGGPPPGGGRRAGAAAWFRRHRVAAIVATAVVLLGAIVAAAVVSTRGDGGTAATSPSPSPQNAAQMEKLLGAAQQLLASGMIQEAVAKARQAHELDPSDPIALEQLGLATLALPGGSPEAMELFQSSINAGAQGARPHALLADTQMDDAWDDKTGDYELVVASARKALDIDPAEPLAHAVLARVAAAEDHRQNAVAEAQEALIAGSEDGLALSGVAWTYGVLGDWEEAVRYSEQAVSREPNHPGLRLQLAEAYREEERYRDAMDAATEALALDQGWETKAHASLGHTLRRQEKYSEAMAEFREALALDPDNDHAAWGLGACLFRQESYEEALPHLERAVDVVPNNANYQNWLGVCYYRLENYEDALPHLERAVEEDSSDADFLCWEAWCYYKLSRYDEARAEVTAALELDPDVEDGQELVDKLDVL